MTRYLHPRWRPWWVSEILFPMLVLFGSLVGGYYLALWVFR